VGWRAAGCVGADCCAAIVLIVLVYCCHEGYLLPIAGGVLIVLILVHCCCHVGCLLSIAGGDLVKNGKPPQKKEKKKKRYAFPSEKLILM
jgi:hypothetical protein